MMLWDGYEKNRHEHLRFAGVDDKSQFIYYKDDNGTIYYTDADAPDAPLRIWCPASMLTAHLTRLYQIKNRYK
jgi:hypothetical protein